MLDVTESADWFVLRQNMRFGPMAFTELCHKAARGTVQPSDLVYDPTQRAWLFATDVEGLDLAEMSTGEHEQTATAASFVALSEPLPSPTDAFVVPGSNETFEAHRNDSGDQIQINLDSQIELEPIRTPEAVSIAFIELPEPPPEVLPSTASIADLIVLAIDDDTIDEEELPPILAPETEATPLPPSPETVDALEAPLFVEHRRGPLRAALALAALALIGTGAFFLFPTATEPPAPTEKRCQASSLCSGPTTSPLPAAEKRSGHLPSSAETPPQRAATSTAAAALPSLGKPPNARPRSARIQPRPRPRRSVSSAPEDYLPAVAAPPRPDSIFRRVDRRAALAQKLFRRNYRSLLACDVMALRRGEKVAVGRTAFSVEIEPGGKRKVKIAGEKLPARLAECYTSFVARWPFPSEDKPYSVKFAKLF